MSAINLGSIMRNISRLLIQAVLFFSCYLLPSNTHAQDSANRTPSVPLLRIIALACTNGLTVICDLPQDGWNSISRAFDTKIDKNKLSYANMATLAEVITDINPQLPLKFELDLQQNVLWVSQSSDNPVATKDPGLVAVDEHPKKKPLTFYSMLALAFAKNKKLVLPPSTQFQVFELCNKKVNVRSGDLLWPQLPEILKSIDANFFFVSPNVNENSNAIIFGLMKIDKDSFVWGDSN